MSERRKEFDGRVASMHHASAFCTQASLLIERETLGSSIEEWFPGIANDD